MKLNFLELLEDFIMCSYIWLLIVLILVNIRCPFFTYYQSQAKYVVIEKPWKIVIISFWNKYLFIIYNIYLCY